MNQATLVIIKPDAIRHGLIGAVLSRLEPMRLEVIGVKVVRVSKALAEEHYQNIRGKPFFDETVEYLMGKFHDTPSVLAFVLWGEQAIERVRAVVGATNPEQASPDTIRRTMGRITTSGLMENVVHASSDSAEAAREIALWFHPSELLREGVIAPSTLSRAASAGGAGRATR